MLQVHDQHRHSYALLEYLVGIAGYSNTNEEPARLLQNRCLYEVCICKLLTELPFYFYLLPLLIHKAAPSLLNSEVPSVRNFRRFLNTFCKGFPPKHTDN